MKMLFDLCFLGVLFLFHNSTQATASAPCTQHTTEACIVTLRGTVATVHLLPDLYIVTLTDSQPAEYAAHLITMTRLPHENQKQSYIGLVGRKIAVKGVASSVRKPNDPNNTDTFTDIYEGLWHCLFNLRRVRLGQRPASIPFILAYKVVPE